MNSSSTTRTTSTTLPRREGSEGREQSSIPTTTPGESRVERVPLTEVLRQIRRDAAEEPGRYLGEVSVPQGGE